MKKYRSDEKRPPSENQVKADRQTNPWLWYVDDFESDEEGDISVSEQTFEEEYSAYVTSLPRRSTVNPIKFWEVNGIILAQFAILVSDKTSHRPITTHSQRYIGLLWTSFPFRHHLFLAKGCSLQALRPTPKSETD